MAKRDKMKTPRKKQARNDAAWRRWGLYDKAPELSEETIRLAVKALGVKDNRKTAGIRNSLVGIAHTYWYNYCVVDEPGEKWYRGEITFVQKATEKLLKVLRSHPGGMAWKTPNVMTIHRMGRLLGKSGVESDPASIIQLLEQFKSVCDHCVRKKGRSGARRQTHLEKAVKEIDVLYRKHTGKSVSKSLDTAPGVSGKEFIYPGPPFVYDVLKGIDTEVAISGVQTALRKALSKRAVQKSRESSS